MTDDAAAAGKAQIIQTERLLLRRHRRDDFGAVAAMWADPAVTRYIGGKPSTPGQSWTRLLGYAGHWSLMNFGYWALEEKATGAFVGELGFADFKRALPARYTGVPELGWALATAAHGRGFATESVAAALAWGDEHLAAPQTIALIDPDNLASVRVARKCGYTPFETITLNERGTLVFVRDAVASPSVS